MGFSCGIVGMPNVGKSTIFNALSKTRKSDDKNHPTSSGGLVRGIVPVPDPRMDFILEYIKARSVVHTTVEFADIAGFAKSGDGQTQFLTHIRQVDALVHVVRCFDDDSIAHSEGTIDPRRDISIIQSELTVADIDLLEKALLRAQKNAKSGDKTLARKAEIISLMLDHVSDGAPIREILDKNPEYRQEVAEYQLITDKPVLYVANVDEAHASGNISYVDTVKEIAAKEGAGVVVLCGQLENDILDLSEEEAKEYLNDLGLKRSGLENLIIEGYDLLKLVTYYTAGEKEVRAWTIEQNTNAKKAAGKIHSDIERGFIRVEVVSFADFQELKSMTLAKEKGKMRLEGKEYIVQDGDILYFRHNT